MIDFPDTAPPFQSTSRHEEDVTRALPHAMGPEKSVLSVIFTDPQKYLGEAIEAGLTKDHFYLPTNQIVFGQMLELYAANQEIELVSFIQRMLDRGLLDRAGGPAAVADIYTYAPSPVYFRQHLAMVREKFILRSLIRVSTETIAAAYDAPGEAMDALDMAEKEIMAIRDSLATEFPASLKDDISQVMQEFVEEAGGGRVVNRGLTTGFPELDHRTCGLKPGDMFVLAARPSMGKTALMMNLVEHAVFELGKSAMVFSCEMTRKQILKRMLFSRANFDVSSLARGSKPTKGELLTIQRISLEIAASRMTIEDKAGLTINELRAKARRAKRENNIDLIAIDYLQLIRCRTRQAENSREREIAEISVGIKNLAKELSLPIIILAQLNRGPDNRTGSNKGVPRLSDLRESGAIEQDADMVALLYRPGYYADSEEDKQAKESLAQLDLAKNRSGATGTIPLTWIPCLTRFEPAPSQKDDSDPFQETAKQQPRSRFQND